MTSSAVQPATRGNLRRLLSSGTTVVALVLVAIVVVLAVFGSLVAPSDPVAQDLTQRYLPPAWMSGGHAAHLFGTDNLGRDVLSRTIAGARVSMVVGVSSVLLQILIGVTLGLCAGYFGGWVDNVVMRLSDVWVSIPFLVLALAVSATLGPGMSNTILVLGAVGWVGFARLIRSQTLVLREREFVLAARTSGRGPWAILTRDVLPNVSGSIIVLATLSLSQMIIAESSLSFLGLGIQPPGIAWGSMIADGLQNLTVAWWVVAGPGLLLMVSTFGVNLLGDALRDALDPKERKR